MRVLLLVAAGCIAPHPDEPASEPDSGAPALVSSWPASELELLIPPAPRVDRAIRIYLDPGHGTGSNHGNRGVRCQSEEDAMLELADDLQIRLADYGPFEVRSARPEAERTSYGRRVARANAWNADVFLSLHSDARGEAWYWNPLPGWDCIRNDRDPGFAILVSDEARGSLTRERADLADAVAKRMAQAGFGPFTGGYGTLYDAGEVPGTWLDRRGLLMLRRPKMRSVIVETHNAYDLNEVRRWDEERTRDAFARAIAHAVLDVVTEG